LKEIKKPRHLRGFFNIGLAEVTSFSSRPSSSLELSLLALSVSPPILASLFTNYCSPLSGKLLVKLFLSHVT
jgi:hypothetical protein